MKQGWLIVNGFLESPKFGEIYKWILEKSASKNVTLRKLTNDQATSILPISTGETDWKAKPDFVLFWDKDVKLARMLEAEGFKVFNSADAIEACDDKSLTFIKLKDTDIPMPVTFNAPLCFESKYPDYTFLLQMENKIGYPMIIKKNEGSFGNEVFLAKDFNEAAGIVESLGPNSFIIQEYIEASKGKSARLQVVGDEVITAMKLTNEEDFKSNVTGGGSMEKYEPTDQEKEIALKACKKLGLDFAGVDIIWKENGEPLLCEINSNAHFKNIFDCTGVDAAEAIIDYILEKI
ncbi:MAG: RimK family alpha-L-glutamate ligase [Eubacterium sp.]|nr:RimK family alpha-L-glutamate ligase [Eubacterium sp.]